MKAYILRDYFGDGMNEVTHTVILRENLEEAAQAIHAEIMQSRGNRALVRIFKYHARELNIPTLNYRLHTGYAVDEGYVLCLVLCECHLTS